MADNINRGYIKQISLYLILMVEKMSYFIGGQIEPGVKDDFQPCLMELFRRFNWNENVV